MVVIEQQWFRNCFSFNEDLFCHMQGNRYKIRLIIIEANSPTDWWFMSGNSCATKTIPAEKYTNAPTRRGKNAVNHLVRLGDTYPLQQNKQQK
jgi:hypothetical protein